MNIKIISTGSKNGNCYTLTSNSGQVLLLDFGVSKKEILRGIDFKISNVAGALLSHSHGDHSKCYKWLLENHIRIYTNSETVISFETATCDYFKGIPEKTWIPVGEFYVMQFLVPHDGCPCSGFLISHLEMGKLLYLTDLEYCPYKFANLNVNHLLIEANYIEDLVNRQASNYLHQIKGHSSLSTTKGIVEANSSIDLRTVTLIHLSDKVCDPVRVLKEVKLIAGEKVEVNVAVPKLEVELKKYPF